MNKQVAIIDDITVGYLRGGVYDNGGTQYAPAQDAHGNWFITEEEIKGTTSPKFEWVKTLELSPYYPPPSPPLPMG